MSKYCITLLRNACQKPYRNHLVLNGLRKSNRYIHSDTTLQMKMYMEHENRYAYRIMENKGYVENIYTAKKDIPITTDEFNSLTKENWSNKSSKQLFEVFPTLATYSSAKGLCISNKTFDSYIDDLSDNIRHASDEELRSLFYSLLKWPETPSIRTRNYIEVWVALDDECLKRMHKWSTGEMLSYISLFYMVNVTRVSDFPLKALNRMASKAKQLTPSELVQTMFFISTIRKAPFDIHNLELHLANNFGEYSLDELAVMSMGYFKSKTPIRNPDLIIQIIKKIISDGKDIHEVSLAALLKIIRYSLKKPEDDIIYKLLDMLQHEVPRLSVMCNVQMALVGMATLTLHKECLEKIAVTIVKSITSTRIKDLERLVLAFGTFNLKPVTQENFFEIVLEELRKPERESEIDQHGKSFACCVAYLSHMGIYPVDLMAKVLSSEFLLKHYGKQVFGYGKEVLAIHNAAKIFCPDVQMNCLDNKGAMILAKRYTDFMPREHTQKQFNASEKFIIDVLKTLKYDRGDEYVIGDHIVTHHQRGGI
jgi:hypothetical protein